jgi:hypothetical protein
VGLTERLRRRWMLVMFSFAGGSAVSGVWSVQGGLAASATTQGLGLGLLAALPLYSCGALLGGMSAPRLSHVRGPVGSAAAAGAALGTILAGYVLAALLLPLSIYAFCLVLLSGAAVVHGWVISAEGERKVLFRAASPYGNVAVEEWSWGKGRREKVLTENGRVRGVEDAQGQPLRRWEKAALEVLGSLASSHAATARDASTPDASTVDQRGDAGQSPAQESQWPDQDEQSPAQESQRPAQDEQSLARDQQRQAQDEQTPAQEASPGQSQAEWLSPGWVSTDLLPDHELRQPPHPSETPLPLADSPERPEARPRAGLLILGGGSLTLGRRLLELTENVEIETVERNAAVLDAAREHFAAPAEGPRFRVRTEDPRLALMDGCAGAYLAVVVDSSAVGPQDPIALSTGRELVALRRCLAGGGVVVVGGVDRSHGRGVPLERLLAEANEVFPFTAVFGSEPDRRAPAVSNVPPSELLLVMATDPDAEFPSGVAGLALETVSRGKRPEPPAPDPGVLP